MPRFYKEVTFDFHCRELPDVILPGQSIEFPIIFRPKKPGVYHETLYLLTHPSMCDQSSRGYSIHLTGLCMEPESAECRHIGVVSIYYAYTKTNNNKQKSFHEKLTICYKEWSSSYNFQAVQRTQSISEMTNFVLTIG